MRKVIRVSEEQLHILLTKNHFVGIANKFDNFRRRLNKNQPEKYPRYHLLISRFPNKVKLLDLHIDFVPHTHYTNNHILIATMLEEFDERKVWT